MAGPLLTPSARGSKLAEWRAALPPEHPAGYDRPGFGAFCAGGKSMRAMTKGLVAVGAALLLGGTAQAGVSLLGSRVGAVDVPALAKFYEAAFGLKEVNRFQFPG